MKKVKQKNRIILSCSVIIVSVIIFSYAIYNWRNSHDVSSNNISIGESNINCYVDSQGIPYIELNNEQLRLPALVAIYTLEYSGEKYFTGHQEKSYKKFWNGINWLEDNLETNQYGYKVWKNYFDYEYKGLRQEKDWFNAFTQAVGIDALLKAYELTSDSKYLELADSAAQVFNADISEGGVKYQVADSKDIWFEEFWDEDNLQGSHALGTHIRALGTLYKLYLQTDNLEYGRLIEEGTRSLINRFNLYDNGTDIIYDLVTDPQKIDFDFYNFYTGVEPDIAVDKIEIIDLDGTSNLIDIGKEVNNDVLELYEEGWNKVENLDGSLIRRTNDLSDSSDFSIYFKQRYAINANDEWIQLKLTYKDEKKDNISLRITNGDLIKELRDSDILLKGNNEWREWKIPIRVQELGTVIDDDEYFRYLEYLKEIQIIDEKLDRCIEKIEEYYHIKKNNTNGKIIEPKIKETLQPLTILPYFPLDTNGVIMQGMVEGTIDNNEKTDTLDKIGKVEFGYNPYQVAMQAIEGSNYPGENNLGNPKKLEGNEFYDKVNWLTKDNNQYLKKEVAYEWLKNNKKVLEDSYIWCYDFENLYNDVIQPKGWQSAFSQKYIVDAFMKLNDKETTMKAINAYKYATEEGGLCSVIDKQSKWYEEVPNNTHILNAHVASLISIKQAVDKFDLKDSEILLEQGMNALKDKMYLYDSGYWSRYDVNPKKQLLFQLDIINGDESPQIDEVEFTNMATLNSTKVDIGKKNDFLGSSYISGVEWKEIINIEGKSTRSFSNGYEIHEQSVEGGTQQNSYISLALPDSEFSEYFSVPIHRVSIRYKDDKKSTLALKIQSISEGGSLKFVPLKNAYIECIGDGRWKTAEIFVYPQNMGWYMGPDYQAYHKEIFDELSKLTDDWYLEQYTQKMEYYLDSYYLGEEVINYPTYEDKKIKFQISNSTATYEGYGFENALDHDRNDNYVATIENMNEYFFDLHFEKPISEFNLYLYWESKENTGLGYKILGSDNGEDWENVEEIDSVQEIEQKILIQSNKPFEYYKIVVNDFSGQKRILLREISVSK